MQSAELSSESSSKRARPSPLNGGSAMTSEDIVDHIVKLVPPKQFLFFAPVSRTWRGAWGRQPLRTKTTSIASPDTSVSQLQESFESGLSRDRPNLCVAIAGLGNVALLQHARASGCVWDETTCSKAACGGHLDVLVYARDNDCPWSILTFAAAARAGHVGALRWLRDNGCPWDHSACDEAARGGHLDALVWLTQEGCLCDEETFSAAAAGGHLDVLDWLGGNGCEGDHTAYNEAAAGGHVNVLLRLEEKMGLRGDEETFCRAAGCGRLNVLELLRDNGCPWDERAGDEAARGDHLEVVRWLRANGYF